MRATAFADLAAQFNSSDMRPSHADEAALIAFATVDPAGAATWLVRQSVAEASEMPRSRLARFLGALASAITRAPGAVQHGELVEIIARHGHLLASEAAAELSSVARVAVVDPKLEEALRLALERAPSNPGLLRPAADLAAASGNHTRAHELLTRLGRSDSGLATIQYVYGTRKKLLETGEPAVRIALLSSFTIDPLVPYVDLECRALRLQPEMYVAPFNTWERELLGEGSGVQRFQPQIAFLAVAADDLLPALATGSDVDLETAGAAAVDRLLAAATRFTAWSSAILVVHGLHTTFRDPLGPAAGRAASSRGEVMNELNNRLAHGLRDLPRCYFLDLPDLLVRRKHGSLDNPKMRHLAGMRLSEHVLGDLAAVYAQYLAPVAGRTRKCVVLDLDNTLWGGIVGEDGPNGIRLGNTSPGSEYREFQQYLQSLTKRGILLAVNSKNNEADALEVIRSHDAMVLREDAFSAMRINWENKPSNMLSIAEELNIGLDSFVFIDDNDKERALMRQALPQVLTPELPRDPARYRETLEAMPELQVLSVTDEDRSRTRQYVERRQREQLRVTAQTPEGYLASLEIVARMDRVSDRTLARVHQLFQRTNQFNLTGKRYELGALTTRAAASGWRIYTSQVSDRFGEHGLVAAALVQVSPDAWTIDNFVMSCRVIGYGVEDALLARVAEDAREASARWLLGEFIPSPKNAPARDFYSRSAFVQDSHSNGETSQRWKRDLSETGMGMPAWITVRSANDA